MNALKKIIIAVLLVCLCMTVTAQARDYVPSPVPGRPIVIDPEWLTDILIVTPYEYRNEMLQQYKIDNFEKADEALTQGAIYRALREYMTDDMRAEYLSVAAHYYIHEKEDQGIVTLPQTITIATGLDFGWNNRPVFVELIHYREDGTWERIPATFHTNGTFTFTLEEYGAYAIITYEVQEHSHHGHHSPQTGAADPLALAAPLAAAGLLWITAMQKLRVPKK